jgi:hypothetical protein
MKLASALLASAALAALVACAPGDASSGAQVASPSPTPTTAAPAAQATAVVTPAPLPTAVVTPAPVGSPAPGITPLPTPVPSPAETPASTMLPADAPPQILSYTISATTVHPGETISGTVLTTSNVASVEATIASYVIPMSKTDVGHFTLSYVVPNIPKPFRGTYALRIVAHNTKGDTVSRSMSLTIK